MIAMMPTVFCGESLFFQLLFAWTLMIAPLLACSMIALFWVFQHLPWCAGEDAKELQEKILYFAKQITPYSCIDVVVILSLEVDSC